MPMLIARLDVNQHAAPQARPALAPVPVPAQDANTLQSTPSQSEYQPPTPISLTDSASPGGGSSASSSITTSSSLLDPPPPAESSHRNPRLPFLRPRHHPRDASQRSSNHPASSQEPRRCAVCWRRDCRLVSHKLYAARPKCRQSQPPSTDDPQPQLSLTASIGNARIDPFFDLPVGRPDPDMQQHFRDFFTTQGSWMTRPVRIRAFDAAYFPVLMRQALADPALCHTFIAMAATYSCIHGHGFRAPDAKLLSIYGRTFKVLRRQIGQASQGKQLDSTIMATINLLMCHGLAFGDKTAIAAHPAALKHLVDACGGLCNLNAQPASLTLWADLYVTLYTGKRPVFLDQARVMPDIPLSNPPSAVYGSGLNDLRNCSLISQSLLDVCLNTCRLTELLEDRVLGNTNPARWEYFNYKRNAMAMRNGMVHSELFGSGTKAECISIIHNLFLFLVLRLMPWNAPLINLCEQLQSALLASGLDDYWGQDIDTLLWVLFMLMAGAEHWPNKHWALEVLLATLSHRYRSEQHKWPPEWCEMQRLNLMRFTWSEMYLTDSFKTTCRDLVTLSQSPTRDSAMQQDAPPSIAGHAAP